MQSGNGETTGDCSTQYYSFVSLLPNNLAPFIKYSHMTHFYEYEMKCTSFPLPLISMVLLLFSSVSETNSSIIHFKWQSCVLIFSFISNEIEREREREKKGGRWTDTERNRGKTIKGALKMECMQSTVRQDSLPRLTDLKIIIAEFLVRLTGFYLGSNYSFKR